MTVLCLIKLQILQEINCQTVHGLVRLTSTSKYEIPDLLLRMQISKSLNKNQENTPFWVSNLVAKLYGFILLGHVVMVMLAVTTEALGVIYP